MAEITYTDLLALVEQDGFKAVRTSTSRGGQYNGFCPFCEQGNDRFRVQPNHGPYGWFACSQCGCKGTAVDYLMLKRGLSKQEALLTVGWKPKDGSEPHFSTPTYPASALDNRPQWDEPSERWQNAARDFYRACQETLWSDAGRAALDYLRGRGLTDTTIQSALLGYHAQERYGSAHIWGKPKPVKLWQGIIIPWLYQGNVWRLTIRDERVVGGNGRYRQVSGGSNGLYLADSLRRKRPAVVVTEGEFDALSIAQVCGKQVAVVATGTTQGGHTPRWISLLAQQRHVLIAFDSEDKGDNAANWWLNRLDHAQRLRPLWKDANQMLQDGANLSEWIIASGVEFASADPVRNDPPALPNVDVTPAIVITTPEERSPDFAPYEVPDRVAEQQFIQSEQTSRTPEHRNLNKGCLTQIYLSEKHPRHIGMPFWLDPQSQKFVGWSARKAFFQGFTDVAGNRWCGHCFYQCQLINRGAQLGYPELPPSYRIAGYPSTGYEAWLALARFGGCVRVETAVRWQFVSAD